MADIITFRGGREAPEGLDRRALLAWLDRVRDQIDRLDGQEPEHMGTEEHERWGELHEELEDLVDELQDRLDELGQEDLARLKISSHPVQSGDEDVVHDIHGGGGLQQAAGGLTRLTL